MDSYSGGKTELPAVNEPPRSTPVSWRGDVVVLGGGAAGCAAAVAAARCGARTLLVERHGYLGGVMTATSLGTICGLYGIDAEARPYELVKGFTAEVVDRLGARRGTSAPVRWRGAVTMPYDAFALKLVLDEMTQAAGVRLALHSQLVDVLRVGDSVTTALIEGPGGRWAAQAPVFVDASGNADLVARGGGDFEFDRSQCQLPTATFRFGNVSDERARAVTRDDLRALLEAANAQGAGLPRTCGGVYFHAHGTAHVNITRVRVADRSPDPFDTFELSDAELEGRRQVLAYEQAFKRHVPGYVDAFVLDSSATLGIRESRRVAGDFRLEIDHVYGAARFDDAVAACAWPVEVHERGSTATRWDWLPPGVHYEIPWRCLLPRGMRNVAVAGRCISASHEAQGSLRVTATCMAMGQAAGVGAALAARSGGALRDVPFASIRGELLRQGALLRAASAASAGTTPLSTSRPMETER